MTIYNHRDQSYELGEYYTRHIFAMTGEALHSKAEIACELAARDAEIERLCSKIDRLVVERDELAADVGKRTEICSGQAAEIERMASWLQAIAEEIDEDGPLDGPGHAHSIPFRWDEDNHPDIAGKPCHWCLMWLDIRAAL